MKSEPLQKAKPLAYFITYHTYGTWLHGDPRESMDRRYFNKIRAPKIPADRKLERVERRLQRQPAFTLSIAMRRVVKDAIHEVCNHRGYTLHAVNVRTNHGHVVVSGRATPEKIMNDLKSHSTRRLREAGLIEAGRRVWVRHGSTRYLWHPAHLAGAVDYVLYGQGDDVPNFDFIDGV